MGSKIVKILILMLLPLYGYSQIGFMQADTSLNVTVGASRIKYKTWPYTLNALQTRVPSARTLTINGVTFDLSANRSWTISAGGSGTVNSVSSTGGYGITTSVATPTTTPAIAISSDTTSATGLVSKPRLSASLSNYMNLTTDQTAAGIKTFSNRVVTPYVDNSAGFINTTSVALTNTGTPSPTAGIRLGGGSSRFQIASPVGVMAFVVPTNSATSIITFRNKDITVAGLEDTQTNPELLKTANYTVLASDWGTSNTLNLMVDATSGNLTITLPTSGMYGRTIQIKKVDTSANTVTISGTIDHATSLTLAMPDSNAQLYSSQLLSKYVTQ